jgi:single-strand DNA-binding protein
MSLVYRPDGSQCFFIGEVRAPFAIDSPAFHAERGRLLLLTPHSGTAAGLDLAPSTPARSSTFGPPAGSGAPVPKMHGPTSGRPVANLHVATTERWTDKAGKAQEHTEWHRVVAWGNLGEVSARHLKKGSLVSVEGPICSRMFTDKEGVERYAFEVIANEVLFLDRAERQKPEDAAPPVGGEDNPF